MERSILFLLLFLHHVSCTSLKRLEIGLQVSKKKKERKKSGKTVLIVNLQGSGGVRHYSVVKRRCADNKCN